MPVSLMCISIRRLNGLAFPDFRASTRVRWHPLSITVLPFIIFLPALRNDFVNPDDHIFVYKTTTSCLLTLSFSLDLYQSGNSKDNKVYLNIKNYKYHYKSLIIDRWTFTLLLGIVKAYHGGQESE